MSSVDQADIFVFDNNIIYTYIYVCTCLYIYGDIYLILFLIIFLITDIAYECALVIDRLSRGFDYRSRRRALEPPSCESRASHLAHGSMAAVAIPLISGKRFVPRFLRHGGERGEHIRSRQVLRSPADPDASVSDEIFSNRTPPRRRDGTARRASTSRLPRRRRSHSLFLSLVRISFFFALLTTARVGVLADRAAASRVASNAAMSSRNVRRETLVERRD